MPERVMDCVWGRRAELQLQLQLQRRESESERKVKDIGGRTEATGSGPLKTF